MSVVVAPHLVAIAAFGWLAALAGCEGRVHRDHAQALRGAPAELVARRGTLVRRHLLTGELVAVRADNITVPRTTNWQIQIRWLEADGTEVTPRQKIVEFDNSSFAANLADRRLAVDRAAKLLQQQEASSALALADKAFRVEEKRIAMEKLRTPSGPGVRYDGGVYAGWEIPVHYDPLIAKLCTWGATRGEAARRMIRALDEFRVDGVKTSIAFHRKMMDHPAFLAGDLHTGFLQEHPEILRLAEDPWLDEIAVIAAAVHHDRTVAAASARARRAAPASHGSAWKWSGRKGWRS